MSVDIQPLARMSQLLPLQPPLIKERTSSAGIAPQSAALTHWPRKLIFRAERAAGALMQVNDYDESSGEPLSSSAVKGLRDQTSSGQRRVGPPSGIDYVPVNPPLIRCELLT